MSGTDQNSDFIFTIDDASKGLDMKEDSEFGLALGVGGLRALCAILGIVQ
jgi:hypothetical protein